MKALRLAFLAVAALLSGCGGDTGRERVSWMTMGTIAAVQTKGDKNCVVTGKLAARTMATFKDVETLLNAHKSDSEISRLAPLADEEVVRRCADSTRPCYEAAFALCKATGGAFNPRWRGARSLDLGAIAKGFAIDLAAEAAEEEGGEVACIIDLGGNVKSVRGTWRTGVKSPLGDEVAAVVELQAGEALATSATYFRGSHIYDGRTNRPVENDIASVTVLCRSAMLADGLSTALFVLGIDEGRAFLENRLRAPSSAGEVSVLWIMKDGRNEFYPKSASARFEVSSR